MNKIYLVKISTQLTFQKEKQTIKIQAANINRTVKQKKAG